jgi:ubiquinone/menaquinone biosynthesis C-methylase UbiE
MSGLIQTLRQFVSPGGIEGYFAIKYAEFAQNTEAMRDEYRRLALTAASKIQSGRVLEVGPGPGYVGIELANLLSEVEIVGLDISDTMIEIAENNAKEHDLSDRIEFRQGDAAQMRFEDAAFDFVISSGSLHHWKEATQIFNEIHRVLKPGCYALISDVRADAPKNEVETLAAQIDSRLMRWGLKHSFGEAYTAQEVGQLIEDVPFVSFTVQEEGISMAIWLRK